MWAESLHCHLPTATSTPRSTGESYEEFFLRHFSRHFESLPLYEKRDTFRRDVLDPLEQATFIFLLEGIKNGF